MSSWATVGCGVSPRSSAFSSGKPVFSLTSFEVTPGCRLRTRGLLPWALPVHHAQVGDGDADVHQVAAHAINPALPPEADAGDHVHLAGHEHAGLWLGTKKELGCG